MAWEQLSVNRPHLAYAILGGFTSLFMLCSLFVKERLYIGEATVATICGIIFGPHAANLFNPASWGNVDQITLECSRIVLVVQCFAVGVELPKAYMEKHWRSVVLLLIPVMTFGWLITSTFIWWMIEPLTWLESLCVAACVTATDPVLASSVVGKGKFAKRVPKHLRDLLSAESGCNDGMAFPFIYLALYLIHYRPHANEVIYHWACLTVLYECVFGAVYGFLIGYVGRHAIRWAESRNLVDRESFLVFYFVLALFCAGTGSMLGVDDLLVGFAAGVGFSNDGWFLRKTEESHVSNVIDLLLNLAYFVYLGAVIPWAQYNAPETGMTPWRLVIIAIFVILFRRIPIMLALKPIIPDIKTWREALFAGHFGPIGVGAIFVAILARAELETDSTTPLAELPPPGSHNYVIVQLIWPITTFLVISSILVHGSSIAVFTLGKHINTLTITMSYTQANEEGPSWMNRLPRISSQAKGSMSIRKPDDTDSSIEKLPEYAPGTLPPIGVPGNFLRRQKEDENGSRDQSRAPSLRAPLRKKKWDSGMGPGGPISQSAIAPQRRVDMLSPSESASDTLNEKNDESPISEQDGAEREELRDRREDTKVARHGGEEVAQAELEAYDEGDDEIIEDEDGNVISVKDVRGESNEQKQQHLRDAGELLREDRDPEDDRKEQQHLADEEDPTRLTRRQSPGQHLKEEVLHPGQSQPYRNLRKKLGEWDWGRHKDETGSSKPPKAETPEQKRGPALAYQFGNTIIVEDEDGEVVKKYELPKTPKKPGQQDRKASYIDPAANRQRLQRMGTWVGMGGGKETPEEAGSAQASSNNPPSKKKNKKSNADNDDDDDGLRFTINAGGHRMGKVDFIKQIQQLDPKTRAAVVEKSDVPEAVKQEARQDAKEQHAWEEKKANIDRRLKEHVAGAEEERSRNEERASGAELKRLGSKEDKKQGPGGLTLVDSEERDIPVHDLSNDLKRYTGADRNMTAAQRRRQVATAARQTQEEDSDDDGTERVPPHHQHAQRPSTDDARPIARNRATSMRGTGETAAERRRREAALGGGGKGSDSEEDNTPRKLPPNTTEEPVGPMEGRRAPGIRFADQPPVNSGGNGGQRLQWGEDVGSSRR
ncbi:MAG: hypothetical protein M1835_007718 [Candelina submexicana]|nr:MAG: hypothetical protein M1835_007718 [Candelina submexicana]